MTSSDCKGLAERIARTNSRDANTRSELCQNIRALRSRLQREPQPDLLEHLDTALQLMGLLDHAGSADPERIVQCVAGLVGAVEADVGRRQGAAGARTAGGDLDQPAEDSLRALQDIVLGEIMTQLDIVSAAQIEEALQVRRDRKLRIGEALVEIGAATQEQVQEALRIQGRIRSSMGGPADVLGAIAPCHPLWKHPFLERARQGRVSVQEVRVLATQMYRFCREFNRILAATLVLCPDERARVVIAANLFDELGGGDADKTHPELFRRFTRALGITDQELEATPVEPETVHLIDTYLGLAQKYGYLASLGGICYASENIVSTLYRVLLSGIQSGVSVSEKDLVFFHVHLEMDCDHADALIDVVNAGVKSVAEAKKVVMAIRDALAARMRFFDGIERCARVPAGPVAAS